MYTFYEYPKCTTCRKAKKELDRLGLDYRSVYIKTNPPKVSLLKELLENSDLDLKKFFNTSGNSYREFDLKDKFDNLMVDEALSLLS